MEEKKNSKPANEQQPAEPENLPVIYNNILSYINSVVTFRFTTLGFFLAAVAIILGGKSSFEKYIALAFITISLYIIELRNRFLKNDLGEQAKLIQKKWGYILDREKYCEPEPTYIFGIRIPFNKAEYEESGITHSIGLDLLYGFIFLYALIRIILLLYGIGL